MNPAKHDPRALPSDPWSAFCSAWSGLAQAAAVCVIWFLATREDDCGQGFEARLGEPDPQLRRSIQRKLAVQGFCMRGWDGPAAAGERRIMDWSPA